MNQSSDIDGDMLTAKGMMRAIRLALTARQQGMLAGLLLENLQAESARCMRRLVANTAAQTASHDPVACAESELA